MGSVSEPIVNDLKMSVKEKGFYFKMIRRLHLLHGDLHFNNLSFKL